MAAPTPITTSELNAYDASDVRLGVEPLITGVLDAVGVSNLANPQRVTARLYGGWFSGARLSRRAQRVTADLSSSFRAPIAMGLGTLSRQVIVHAQLAGALIVQPRSQFQDTYREGRADLARYSVASAPYTACAAPGACPLHAVIDVARDGDCPVTGCGVKVPHVLTRHEQKLVDTMMVADIIEVARQKLGPIVVVSSDDDVWPGVVAATTLGARVFHVQSRSRKAPSHYTAQAPTPLYSQHILPIIP